LNPASATSSDSSGGHSRATPSCGTASSASGRMIGCSSRSPGTRASAPHSRTDVVSASAGVTHQPACGGAPGGAAAAELSRSAASTCGSARTCPAGARVWSVCADWRWRRADRKTLRSPQARRARTTQHGASGSSGPWAAHAGRTVTCTRPVRRASRQPPRTIAVTVVAHGGRGDAGGVGVCRARGSLGGGGKMAQRRAGDRHAGVGSVDLGRAPSQVLQAAFSAPIPTPTPAPPSWLTRRGPAAAACPAARDPRGPRACRLRAPGRRRRRRRPAAASAPGSGRP
jgi:hypothetical protein